MSGKLANQIAQGILLATVILVSLALVSDSGAFQECGDWVRVASPNSGSTATFIGGTSGVADDDVWSVGWFRVPAGGNEIDTHPFSMHWDGGQWNDVRVPVPPSGLGVKVRLDDVTAVANDDVWAVGNYIPPGNVNTIETLTMHWDGSEWDLIGSPMAQIGSGSAFRAVDSRDGELWAVGYSGGAGSGGDNLAARWNGSGWDEFFPVRINAGHHELNSVDIYSADEVWAAGNVGSLGLPYVTRWDGSSWEVVTPRIDSSIYRGLSSIIVLGPNNVWVGASRVDKNLQLQYFVFLHFDGNMWTETQTVAPYHVPNFEGNDPDNFFSGGFGTLAHFDGKNWNLVDSLAVDVWTISDITVLPSGTVWGAGNTYDTGSPETLTARMVPCDSGRLFTDAIPDPRDDR